MSSADHRAAAIKWVQNRNQCCGSGMYIPDLGSWFLSIPDLWYQISDPGSQIPDPGSNNSNKRGGGIIFAAFFFHFSFTKFKTILFFWKGIVQKKIWAIFQRITVLFCKKIITKLSKIWVGDPRCPFQVPDPGVKKASDPGSGSATDRNPQILNIIVIIMKMSLDTRLRVITLHYRLGSQTVRCKL